MVRKVPGLGEKATHSRPAPSTRDASAAPARVGRN